MAERVWIREVGLRDGLQMVKAVLPTEHKLAWLRGAVAAGIPELEITSFVPPASIPQFADADAVATGARDVAGATLSALVVNLKGAERAFAAGFAKVNYVVSASAAHSLANARRTTEAALDEFDRIVALRRERGLDGTVELGCGIATAFGCTIQGAVDPAVVERVAERLLAAGVDELMLADTVGYANPVQVRAMVRRILGLAGRVPVAAHFHDTRGLGLANAAAALDAGILRFDASLAGLGGCPFAPGATGNIATEDCTFMLDSMGFETGIDLDALLALRAEIAAWLPGERLAGALSRAGLPKGFSRAA